VTGIQGFQQNEYDFEPPRRQGRQEKHLFLEIKNLAFLAPWRLNFSLLGIVTC
jgi:hypothetical protein